MNLKEQINQIKVKYESVSNNWDNLTIEQVMKIESLLDEIVSSEQSTETKHRSSSKIFSSSSRYLMTVDMFDKMTKMRSRRITWDEIAKKFGFYNGCSASACYKHFKNKHKTETITIHRNPRFIMTDDVFNQITELRSRNITWSEIAKKFGYLNAGSACNSYGQVKQRRKSRLKHSDTKTV